MLEVKRDIDAPADVVWELFTDTAAWPLWGPTVRAVRAPARHIAAGMRGRVITPLGVALPFEITAFSEGRSWRWRVAGVFATGHRVVPLSADRCRAVFEVPSYAAPYALVCRRALRRIARLAAMRQRSPGDTSPNR